jgi:hypothetical protein
MRSIKQHRSFCITSGVYPKMAIHECLEHEQIKPKSIAKKTSFHKASHQRGKSVRWLLPSASATRKLDDMFLFYFLSSGRILYVSWPRLICDNVPDMTSFLFYLLTNVIILEKLHKSILMTSQSFLFFGWFVLFFHYFKKTNIIFK